MKISVILCTFNRCQSLATALGSIVASTVPPLTEWEVLVVDNNSNDQTRDVVEEFRRLYPGRFRYLFESRPGKSFALNSGIREALGDVLVFVDDDVTVDRMWLQALTGGLFDGGWAGAGGRVLPQWTVPVPVWLPRDERYSLAPLAMFDLGPDGGPLTEPPFGTNMAFQRIMFEKFGDFRTDLGPRPGSEIRSEDTEFGRRLLSAGERLRYEPSAIVYHPVPPHRTQKRYFLKWWHAKARADIREFGIPRDTRFFLAGIPLYLFRRLAVWTLRWTTAYSARKRFSCKLKVWGVAGQIIECYQTRRSRSEANVVSKLSD